MIITSFAKNSINSYSKGEHFTNLSKKSHLLTINVKEPCILFLFPKGFFSLPFIRLIFNGRPNGYFIAKAQKFLAFNTNRQSVTDWNNRCVKPFVSHEPFII